MPVTDAPRLHPIVSSTFYRNEYHGNEGNGKSQVVFPRQPLLENKPADQSGETDHPDVVDGKQYHVVETAHGMEDAVGGKEINDPQGNAADNALVLPFCFSSNEFTGYKDNTEQHGNQVDEGNHKTHVVGVVTLLVEFHQNVARAGAEEDQDGKQPTGSFVVIDRLVAAAHHQHQRHQRQDDADGDLPSQCFLKEKDPRHRGQHHRQFAGERGDRDARQLRGGRHQQVREDEPETRQQRQTEPRLTD